MLCTWSSRATCYKSVENNSRNTARVLGVEAEERDGGRSPLLPLDRKLWRLRWVRSERFVLPHSNSSVLFLQSRISLFFFFLRFSGFFSRYSSWRMEFSSRSWTRCLPESSRRMGTPASRLGWPPWEPRSSSGPLGPRTYSVIFFHYVFCGFVFVWAGV